MSNSKLFVSNLDFELKMDDLKKIFSEFGPVVNITLVADRETGKSRGYCFIEMAVPEDALKAIDALNTKVFNGRPISVAEDRGKKAVTQEAPQFLQPMQRVLFFKKKSKLDPFEENPKLQIDFRDIRILSRYLSDRGRILPRRLTGLSAYNQRRIAKAIKRSQNVGLLGFSGAV
ncbi:MAG: 30S ribosomal protein S18 [bacterium]|nr:30S ribosomal protein S18 [bacterium]